MGKSSEHVRLWPNKPGFAEEQECWEVGYELIGELCTLRGMGWQRTPTRPTEAATAIQNYCHRLRLSPKDFTLPRMQRELRLTDEQVIVVVNVMAAFWTACVPCTYNQIFVVACGFAPERLQRFYLEIQSRRGVGKLIYLSGNRLRPTGKLFDLIHRPLDHSDVAQLYGDADGLPTTPPDRMDIPDNEPPETEPTA